VFEIWHRNLLKVLGKKRRGRKRRPGREVRLFRSPPFRERDRKRNLSLVEEFTIEGGFYAHLFETPQRPIF
jgi:hypothetical protein